MEPIPAPVKAAVLAEIHRIETIRKVHVLFAVESGSRAWGFPSPDSDWDVRFVYAAPPEAMLGLWRTDGGRDTIEATAAGDLDIAGWRSDKALKLMLKGNCSLREWLASPLVYCDAGWIHRFRALAEVLPNGRRSAYWHYRSLLLSIWSRYIHGEETFSLKRYLYVIRPALAMIWLRQHEAGTPPMDMPALLRETMIPAIARIEINALLARKALASEIGDGPPIPVLHDLVLGTLDHEWMAGPKDADDLHRAIAGTLHRETLRAAGAAVRVTA
jgi:uncharacterized protein